MIIFEAFSKPEKIYFTADKDDGGRVSLYTRMVSRYAAKFGYDTEQIEGRSYRGWLLTKR